MKRPYGLVQLLVSTEDELYKNNKGKVMGRHRSLILKQDGTVLIDEMNDSVEYRDNFIERFKYLNYTNNATTKLITSIRDYGVDTEYTKLKRDIVKDGWVRNLWPHFTIMEDDKYQVVNNHHSNIRIDNAGFIVRNTIEDTKNTSLIAFDKSTGEVIAERRIVRVCGTRDKESFIRVIKARGIMVIVRGKDDRIAIVKNWATRLKINILLKFSNMSTSEKLIEELNKLY